MDTTPQVENHIKANGNLSPGKVMLLNFLGGLSWGLGSVIGATVVFAIVAFILKSLGVFDGISNLFQQLKALTELNQQLPQIPLQR